MSLRFRLVLIVLVLVAAGLVASNLATAALLRSYFMGQVDDRLDATSGFTARVFVDGTEPPFVPGNPPAGVREPTSGVPDVQAARIDRAGRVVSTLRSPFSSSTDAFSALPAAALANARKGEIVRFEMTSGADQYRGIAQPISGSSDIAVVISPLREIEATLMRLYWIQGIATGLLLLSAGGLAFWLVRVGLRPLRHITDTADAVASGDVDRRVDVSGGYEVARLGHALNSAFDARSASEQTLRSFISDASHELRTPLTSIRGYAELLRAGAVPGVEESRRAVVRIEHEAARMGGLVDDLLALARLDEGRPLELGDVDLTVLAADAVNDARAVEPDRPITLIAPAPVHVVGDETSLRQVLANLLSNAREHTSSGVAVEARVVGTTAGARIEVLDDGHGLDASECERVFDRFWRARGQARGPEGGSGLGLAIVAAVAAAHGGRAWAEPNGAGWRGAHFVVDLPSRPPA
jgi:two-component system OmpR family sensor kinase